MVSLAQFGGQTVRSLFKAIVGFVGLTKRVIIGRFALHDLSEGSFESRLSEGSFDSAHDLDDGGFGE